MIQHAHENLRVYEIDGQEFVFVQEGRGLELQTHLASHGIITEISTVPGLNRLVLKSKTASDVLQAILDEWER